MFENTNAFSGFAVKDVGQARSFYGETLGVAVSGQDGLMWLNFPGGTKVLIYPKPDHKPANCTILNFPVPDIEAAVDELGRRGVTFERYPGMEADEKGIFRGGGPLIAWFTDPSGNILSVLQED
ncbi:VOC family protein [Streptomyces triculaminicus]|uniref:VOC family protein n=1 Tax=Streptomyces triculaminicus TaxID=2816232 RepID=UPI0037CD3AEB